MVLVNKNTAAEVLAAVYDEENDAIRTTATIDGSDIQVGGHSAVPAAKEFTLDTSAYSSGDVLSDTLEIDNMVRVNDGTGIFTSVTLIDEDDQGAAMTLVVLDANVSLGTKNSAPSISDGNSRNVLGIISIGTADWIDLGGTRVAQPQVKPFVVKGASGTKKLYFALLNGTGTPMFTANGIRIRPGVIQD